ncbi:DsbA family protein [Diaminobutyricibacter sp. McL0618]|uniref:DsbA family protein n=1 Tax=Leifsonia sp. McL0618 TaxID=3415677 RepID=UPI003CFA6AF8
MTHGGPTDSRPSRNDRREAAREKARQLRVEQKKRDRRNKVFLQSGIIVGVLAIAAVVVLIIVSAIRPPVPGPANMASDGVVVGAGLKVVPTESLAADASPIASTPDPSGSVVSIRMYIDYLCPFCGEFEKTNGDQLGEWAKSGAATVEVHPIAILTSHSAGTKYSLRAANAAACVANYSGDQFWNFHRLLFENQPQEGGPGLTDAQLKGYVSSAGAKNVTSIDKCIDDGTYTTWVANATDRALAGPIPNSNVPKLTGTPLVIVNGKQYTGSLTSADDFKAFVLQAQGDAYSTATPTPSPSK